MDGMGYRNHRGFSKKNRSPCFSPLPGKETFGESSLILSKIGGLFIECSQCSFQRKWSGECFLCEFLFHCILFDKKMRFLFKSLQPQIFQSSIHFKNLEPSKNASATKKKQTNSHSQCNVRQFAFQKHPFKHPKKAILKNDRCNCISSFLQLLWIDESMNDGLMNRCGNFLCTSEKPSLGWSMFCTSSKSQLAPGFEGHLCWTKQC